MRSLFVPATFCFFSLYLQGQLVLPTIRVSPQAFLPTGYQSLPSEERFLPDTDNRSLTFNDGSTLYFPPASLLNEDSTIYRGPVRIQYRKMERPIDIWVSGVPMSYSFEGKPGVLETGGMVELRVFSVGGQPLLPNPSARPQLTLKTSALPDAEDMRLYRLNEARGTWQEDAPQVATVRDSFQLLPRSIPVYKNEPAPFLGLQLRKRMARHKRNWPEDMPPGQAFVGFINLAREGRFVNHSYMNDLIVLNYSRKEIRKALKEYRVLIDDKRSYAIYRIWIEPVSELSFLARLEFEDGTRLELELMPLYFASRKVEAVHKHIERQKNRSQRKGVGVPEGNYFYAYASGSMDKKRHFYEDSVFFSNASRGYTNILYDSTIIDTLWVIRNGQNMVFRQMPLFGFGVLNCDRPMAFPQQWKPQVAMYDERGEFAPSSGIYMAAKGVNTLFVYNSRNAIRQLGLYKKKQQVLFLKMPTNELAACYIDPSVFDANAFPKQLNLRFQTIEEAELGRWLSFDSKITAMVKP